MDVRYRAIGQRAKVSMQLPSACVDVIYYHCQCFNTTETVTVQFNFPVGLTPLFPRNFARMQLTMTLGTIGVGLWFFSGNFQYGLYSIHLNSRQATGHIPSIAAQLFRSTRCRLITLPRLLGREAVWTDLEPAQPAVGSISVSHSSISVLLPRSTAVLGSGDELNVHPSFYGYPTPCWSGLRINNVGFWGEKLVHGEREINYILRMVDSARMKFTKAFFFTSSTYHDGACANRRHYLTYLMSVWQLASTYPSLTGRLSRHTNSTWSVLTTWKVLWVQTLAFCLYWFR